MGKKEILQKIDALFEKMPLDKGNEFLQKHNIKLDLKSSKFKKICAITIGLLFLLLFFSMCDIGFNNTKVVCFCPEPIREKWPAHPESRGAYDIISCAGNGDWESVKYIEDKYYDHILPQWWRLAFEAALKNGDPQMAVHFLDKGAKLSEEKWEELLRFSLGDLGSCSSVEFILEESAIDINKLSFGDVTEDFQNLCKFEKCIKAGFDCRKPENAIESILNRAKLLTGALINYKSKEAAEKHREKVLIRDNQAFTIISMLLENGYVPSKADKEYVKSYYDGPNKEKIMGMLKL